MVVVGVVLHVIMLVLLPLLLRSVTSICDVAAAFLAARHLHICSVRSRFFLLPPVRSRPGGPRGGQLRIDSLYQQLADSCSSTAPDSTATEPYALCVRSCCRSEHPLGVKVCSNLAGSATPLCCRNALVD